MKKLFVTILTALAVVLPALAKNEVDTLFIERTRTVVISADADTILNELTTEVFSRGIRPDKRQSQMATDGEYISNTKGRKGAKAKKSKAVSGEKDSNAHKERIPVAFAWGADAGASIDLTNQDMSDIEFSAFFGMRRGWINFLGIGAAADFMTSNSARSYPIFVDFRTNFRNRPSLLFWGVRAGVSLNYLEHAHFQSGAYVSTGLGINLARNKTFCSYIYLGYTFRHRDPIEGIQVHDFHNIHYASAKIGITF
ncbi:MAG: hypothetical protein K2M55_03740 [Muribaculaceae bacterium]|nr:hypothetical protein [Muribaculaceae bacterium]